MQRRCSGPTNHDRNLQTGALHFHGHMHHFVQGRSDQTTQTNDIHFFFNGFLNNGFRRYHYSQINDFIVVASHHHRHDILSNVVDITLYRSQQNLTCFLSTFFATGFYKRLQDGNGFLHGTGGLHHLRQEHLTGTKQLAYLIHTGHQWPLNDIHHTRILLHGFFQIGIQILTQAFDQCILQALFYGCLSPCLLLRSLCGNSCRRCFQRFGLLNQTLSSIRTTVQNHILDTFQHISRDVTIQD